jgi:ammonium transporter Rh
VIVSNTIISLTGSCLGAFIISSTFREKIDMEDILNATLAGGVVIGAPSGLFTNPAASLTCGLLAGIISTLGFIYLSKFLNGKIGLMDTCGVHNLHGIPGLLGGILSAVAIAAYQSSPMDGNLGINLPFFSDPYKERSLNEQAWWQILGTITSLGIGLVSGGFAGYLMGF